MKLILVKIFVWGMWWRRLKAKRAAAVISKIELSKCLTKYKTTQEFLLNLRSRKNPAFFIEGKDFKLENRFFRGSQGVISEADSILAHHFDLLGSGERNINREEGKIEWHADFKSGEKWDSSIFYTDTVIVKGNGSDIKVPWELSRFQYLPTLGKAYWFTGDEKYAKEFVDEISDWIESNPPQYGVNWTCTMDVAIRVVNWVWGLYFFKDSPEVSDEFWLKFFKSLLIHGKHIMGNLERSWRGINSNHYLSDIVGLVYLGVMFPEFKEAKKWQEFSVRELIRELRKQAYADGVDYEGSVSYHRLVTELFVSATLLCLKNGVVFPEWYMERLEKMLEFVMYYTKPNGSAPQIGDNDDGRLHILANYGNWNRLDHRYLLSIGAVLFNRADFKEAAGEFHEEAFWLLGEEGLRRFSHLSNVKTAAASSKVFANGGFYIMRKDSLYMIIDCVPADSKAPCGHKHNSRLSFELFAYDKSFIIDPGAYIYTAAKEMRNLFRSTRYHNTVVVDGDEQNRFDEDELFRIGLDAAIRVNNWEATEDYDLLDVEHSGYSRLTKSVIHRRLIFFDKQAKCWVIRDVLTGKGWHRFDLYFHLAPLEAEIDDKFPGVVRTKTEGANLAIIPLNINGMSVEIEEGWVSYRYGVKVKAPIVNYKKEAEVPTDFSYILYPSIEEISIDEVIHKAKNSKAVEFLEVAK